MSFFFKITGTSKSWVSGLLRLGGSPSQPTTPTTPIRNVPHQLQSTPKAEGVSWKHSTLIDYQYIICQSLKNIYRSFCILDNWFVVVFYSHSQSCLWSSWRQNPLLHLLSWNFLQKTWPEMSSVRNKPRKTPTIHSLHPGMCPFPRGIPVIIGIPPFSCQELLCLQWLCLPLQWPLNLILVRDNLPLRTHLVQS